MRPSTRTDLDSVEEEWVLNLLDCDFLARSGVKRGTNSPKGPHLERRRKKRKENAQQLYVAPAHHTTAVHQLSVAAAEHGYCWTLPPTSTSPTHGRHAKRNRRLKRYMAAQTKPSTGVTCDNRPAVTYPDEHRWCVVRWYLPSHPSYRIVLLQNSHVINMSASIVRTHKQGWTKLSRHQLKRKR